eukprot:870337-Rhodomonas_salina.4
MRQTLEAESMWCRKRCGKLRNALVQHRASICVRMAVADADDGRERQDASATAAEQRQTQTQTQRQTQSKTKQRCACLHACMMHWRTVLDHLAVGVAREVVHHPGACDLPELCVQLADPHCTLLLPAFQTPVQLADLLACCRRQAAQVPAKPPRGSRRRWRGPSSPVHEQRRVRVCARERRECEGV